MKRLLIIVFVVTLVIGLFNHASVQHEKQAPAPITSVPIEKYRFLVDAMNEQTLSLAMAKTDKIKAVTDMTNKRDQLCTLVKTKKISFDPQLCQ